MTAKYLLRMDDACPTMDSRKWQMLEDLFDKLGIKPVVAVVPDNQDPELQYDRPNPKFWDKVRSWQAKGWTIAMHGYQHVMHHTTSKLILPFYQRSEFAGLTYEEQATKIQRARRTFEAQGVEPTVWIAPAHCFDRLTLEAIRAETPIRIISDGIARNPYVEDGFFWIPQQLWGLTEKHDGLWTVCLHPNTMSDPQIAMLRKSLADSFLGRVVSLNDVELEKRSKSVLDHLEAFFFWQRHRQNKMLNRAKAILRG